MTRYFVGLDLGRDQDHSAIAVMALRADHLNFGALQRIPLGTPYLDVITHLARVVVRLKATAPVTVVLDAAGPGQVALELIRARQLGIQLVPTLLSGGRHAGRSKAGKVTIPRRELVSTLLRLLAAGVVRVHPALKHYRQIELEIAQISTRSGQSHHDDLAIAAALAAWCAATLHPRLLTHHSQLTPGVNAATRHFEPVNAASSSGVPVNGGKVP